MKNKDLLPIGLLISFVIIFFWEIITMDWIFFQGDIMHIFYPIKLFYSEWIKRFDFPLWLPYIQCGFPVFGVGNQGFMYPLNLLLFFCLPTYIAFNLSWVIHFILGGIFTYFFGRVIGLSRASALISAIIFMFSGFSISHLEHPDILNSIIWLPLILTFIEKILREDKKRYLYVILAGIFIGIQILSGHQQITFYSLLCISLYFVYGVFTRYPEKILNFSLIFILLLVIGVGVSAIQTIPTYELLPLSNRGDGVSLEFANIGNFPPQKFITFIFPYFFGDRNIYWGKWFFTEGCIYVGIMSLILFLFGIFFNKNKYIYFFSFLLIFSAILMVGSYTPLFTMLHHLPIFNSIRAPARFGILVIFSISILAGFGFSSLITQKINKKICLRVLYLLLPLVISGIVLLNIVDIWRLLPQGFPDKRIAYIQEDLYFFSIFLTLSLILLILWLKQKIRALIFCPLIIFLIFTDLFIFGIKGMPQCVKISKLPSILIPQTARFLIQKEGDNPYRIMSVYSGKIKIVSKDKDPVDTFRKLLSPNFNICSHLQHIDMVCGLLCIKYWQKVIYIFRQGTCDWISQEDVVPLIIKNIQLLNLLNVKYILFTLDVEDERFETVFEDNGVKIIENKQVLPRAFVVHNFKVIRKKEDILNEISSKEFNPEKYIILEEDLRPKTKDRRPKTENSPTPHIIKYKNEEVVVACNMKDSGFLVLSDLYYPGWQVYVNGKKEHLYRAYYLMRAVYLEEGNHLVKFKYEPLSFKIGMFITLLTILGIVIFLSIQALNASLAGRAGRLDPVEAVKYK